MMKKYMAAGMITISILGAVAGCGRAEGKDIGKEAALEVALQDAKVTEEETTRLKTSKDFDDGRRIYEIQFDANGIEYDYEIAAADGKIVSADTESISNTAMQNPTQDKQDNSTEQNQNSSGQTDQNAQQNSAQNVGVTVAVSQEEAMKTALERVPGATESDIRIELDNDDGQYKYEGDIIYDQREYEFEIDANTGNVLEWSEERR